jgi:hypothetical protein
MALTVDKEQFEKMHSRLQTSTAKRMKKLINIFRSLLLLFFNEFLIINFGVNKYLNKITSFCES